MNARIEMNRLVVPKDSADKMCEITQTLRDRHNGRQKWL